MIKPKKWAIVVLQIAALILLILLCVWAIDQYQQKKAQDEQKIQAELIGYIASTASEQFDFVATATRFDLDDDHLRDHLFWLERNGQIKCIPRYNARKPIVISLNDMLWYFDRINVVIKNKSTKNKGTHRENEDPPVPVMNIPPVQTT
jgi:hypothetical protein